MKSQFDPDVWAALLMIMIVGFGGITFMSMFINGFTMHGLLSIFDQEYNQRCNYFLLPIVSNDYAVVDESPDKNINYTAKYFVINEPERQTYFDDFMEKVNKTIGKGFDIGENQTAKAVCWGLGDSTEVSEKIGDCEAKNSQRGYKLLIMDCSAMVYGPAGVGVAEVVFIG